MVARIVREAGPALRTQSGTVHSAHRLEGQARDDRIPKQRFQVEQVAGQLVDLGVLQRLMKIVPQGVAREMAYTGDRVGAERALQIGLVNAVLPDAAATLEHAMLLARGIAAKSPLAIAGSKLALNHARDHGTAAALQQMTLLQSAIFDTDEMTRAIAAWKDKREPDFAPLVDPPRG